MSRNVIRVKKKAHASLDFLKKCDVKQVFILERPYDKVTVCRSKKRYHWSKTSMICFYHQIPRLSADTYMDDP